MKPYLTLRDIAAVVVADLADVIRKVAAFVRAVGIAAQP